MSPIRPEVLAFLRAAQVLVTTEEGSQPLPLSDEETDIIVACMTRLDNLLQDGGLPRSDGDGHP